MMLDARAVAKDRLADEVRALKDQGLVFVTVTCVQVAPEGFDLLYHFDRDLTLVHLRLAVAGGEVVPSISPVFPAAFLVENEIQDQFGLKFSGLVIDYEGKLYLDEEAGRAPFCTMTVRRLPAGDEAAPGQGEGEA